ncbi:uncharacterized protein LOC144875316 isoform X2 [Branchiostoma floridae x Branchiostoma japonicum]
MGPPDHGSRSPVKRVYNVGEQVTYTCNEGYTLDSRHTSRVRCFGDDIWQYDKPSCSVDIRGTLHDDLLYGYSPNQAPDTKSVNQTHTVVIFSGTVEQITDLTWQDSRLKWNSKYYGNIETLSVPGSSIWTPTLTLKRNADSKYQGLPKDVPIVISTDGTVTWRVETLTSTICNADPFFFPADTMECHICFSLSAIEQTIECGEGSSCDVWSPPQQEGEWNRKDKIFADGKKKSCFAVHLERIPLFHIATTVGPCVILVVLMTITFIMPIDKGDRISFGVTILLSMVVSLVFVTEVLPVKGALPFFATLIVVCMALMGLFLFFTMYIITLHDKEGSLSPMAKTFFFHYMAKFLLFGDLIEKEAASGEGETGPTGGKPAWHERANRVISADSVAKVDGEETTDNVCDDAAETDGKSTPTDVFDDMIMVEVDSQAHISDDMVKIDVETPADVSDEKTPADVFETTSSIPVDNVAEADAETPAGVYMDVAETDVETPAGVYMDVAETDVETPAGVYMDVAETDVETPAGVSMDVAETDVETPAGVSKYAAESGEETPAGVSKYAAESDEETSSDVSTYAAESGEETPAGVSKYAAESDEETSSDVSTYAAESGEETSADVSDDMAKVDREGPAAAAETAHQPCGPPTRLEAAVTAGFRDLIRIVKEEQTSYLRHQIRLMEELISIVKVQAVKTEQQMEDLTKAVKGDQEVSDYTLLTKVLDRLCLVLYVFSVAVAVPMTMYLGN